jgi:hypothetical protein
MQIMFINNDGGGFADRIIVKDRLTVKELFNEKIGSSTSPRDYLIRVNRQAAEAEQVLQEGDRVSFTPTKIEGAMIQTAVINAAVIQAAA